jgi:obg-like ATPase 1
MPPKKKEEGPKKTILGRASNGLSMGLVGLPNVGKSTTFNVVSKLSVPAENYPFCTIDPNTARVNITDKRFDQLCEMYSPKSKVQAQIAITDIAGLVKGASTGAGLGNAFLSHINGVDGIYHVVRAFPNEEVIHEEGDLDPIRDIGIINGELIAKDLQHVERVLSEVNARIKRKKEKKDEEELACITRVNDMLLAGKFVKDGEWSFREIDVLNNHLFLTSKPIVYLVNIGDVQYIKKQNAWLPKIAEFIKTSVPGPMIAYSAEFESQVVDAGKDDPVAQLEKANELGGTSMINKIIRAGLKNLNLCHFFTSGTDEVRQWTLREGSKAPQAGAVIHTDFEKFFICAEQMKFTDLMEAKTEQEVKANGLYRQQGKEYVVLDGDILYFKIGATQGKKK